MWLLRRRVQLFGRLALGQPLLPESPCMENDPLPFQTVLCCLHLAETSVFWSRSKQILLEEVFFEGKTFAFSFVSIPLGLSGRWGREREKNLLKDMCQFFFFLAARAGGKTSLRASTPASSRGMFETHVGSNKKSLIFNVFEAFFSPFPQKVKPAFFDFSLEESSFVSA